MVKVFVRHYYTCASLAIEFICTIEKHNISFTKNCLGRRRHRKACSRRQGHNRYISILAGGRQQWQIGWTYGLFSRYSQRIRDTREGGGTRSHGCGRRQLTNI